MPAIRLRSIATATACSLALSSCGTVKNPFERTVQTELSVLSEYVTYNDGSRAETKPGSFWQKAKRACLSKDSEIEDTRFNKALQEGKIRVITGEKYETVGRKFWFPHSYYDFGDGEVFCRGNKYIVEGKESSVKELSKTN